MSVRSITFGHVSLTWEKILRMADREATIVFCGLYCEHHTHVIYAAEKAAAKIGFYYIIL